MRSGCRPQRSRLPDLWVNVPLKLALDRFSAPRFRADRAGFGGVTCKSTDATVSQVAGHANTQTTAMYDERLLAPGSP